MLVESGAACFRGVAQAVAHVRRFWRMVRTVSVERATPGSQWRVRVQDLAARTSRFVLRTRVRVVTGFQAGALHLFQAYERLAEWIANLDTTVPPVTPMRVQQAVGLMEAPPPTATAVRMPAEHLELAELKASIISQQQELAHMSAQLQELKALVVSQQQVLMFLGKEFDTTQASSVGTVASAPAKSTRVVRAKSGPKEKKLSQKGTSKPSLNL
jgi:hypothetical protein